MKYAVLIKLSKAEISFWYKSEDGTPTSLPLEEKLEIPLAFDSDFVDKIEDRLEKNVVYSSESIVDQRKFFPLLFWFNYDLADNEKQSVLSLFREAGYENIKEVEYEKVLLEILAAKENIPTKSNVLLLNSIHDNLHINYYESGCRINADVMEGMGKDPCYELLAKEILKVIQDKNTHLSFDNDKEMGKLLEVAEKAIENREREPIISGEVQLSHNRFKYSNIKIWLIINERFKSLEESKNPLLKLKQFAKNQRKSRSNIHVVINRKVYTDCFVKIIKEEFSETIGFNFELDKEDDIQFVFNWIEKNDKDELYKSHLNKGDECSKNNELEKGHEEIETTQNLSNNADIKEEIREENPSRDNVKKPKLPFDKWRIGIIIGLLFLIVGGSIGFIIYSNKEKEKQMARQEQIIAATEEVKGYIGDSTVYYIPNNSHYHLFKDCNVLDSNATEGSVEQAFKTNTKQLCETCVSRVAEYKQYDSVAREYYQYADSFYTGGLVDSANKFYDNALKECCERLNMRPNDAMTLKLQEELRMKKQSVARYN